jgi:hypothetical protein
VPRRPLSLPPPAREHAPPTAEATTRTATAVPGMCRCRAGARDDGCRPGPAIVPDRNREPGTGRRPRPNPAAGPPPGTAPGRFSSPPGLGLDQGAQPKGVSARPRPSSLTIAPARAAFLGIRAREAAGAGRRRPGHRARRATGPELPGRPQPAGPPRTAPRPEAMAAAAHSPSPPPRGQGPAERRRK